MSFDYSKLKGKIVEKCGTQKKFAEKMQLSERTLTLKLSGQVEWKQSEIIRAQSILGLREEEILSIFFTLIDQDIEQFEKLGKALQNTSEECSTEDEQISKLYIDFDNEILEINGKKVEKSVLVNVPGPCGWMRSKIFNQSHCQTLMLLYSKK